jgi:Nucleotidyltransferase domain
VRASLPRSFRHFSFVEELRVFGSRANGIARWSSDLDLAISSPEATPRLERLPDKVKNETMSSRVVQSGWIHSYVVAFCSLERGIWKRGSTFWKRIDRGVRCLAAQVP